MTKLPDQTLGNRISQCKVIQNIEALREDITVELKQYSDDKLTHKGKHQTEVDEQFQREIARLTVLLQRTERLALRTREKNYRKLGELNNLVNSLKIGVTTLFDTQPNIELSRQIRLTVEQEIIRHENPPCLRFIARRFSYAWHSPSTPLKVIHGLIFSFIIIFGGLFGCALFLYIALQSRNSVADYKQISPSLELRKTGLEKQLELKESEIREQGNKIKKVNPELNSRINPINPQKLLNSRTSTSRLSSDDEKSIEIQSIAAYEPDLRILENLQKQKGKIINEIAVLEKRINKVEPKLHQQFFAYFYIDESGSISQLLWVAAAGTLGSIISILIRVIDGFHDKEYQDRLTPFFLGFFKPVIGASFGMLFLAIYNSEFVNMPFITRTARSPIEAASQSTREVSNTTTPSNNQGTQNGVNASQSTNQANSTVTDSLNRRMELKEERKEAFFLFAIAFVVGFSERLAKDTIGKIDGSSSQIDKLSHSNNAARIVVIRHSKLRFPTKNNSNNSSSINSNNSDSNSYESSHKQKEADLDQNRALNKENRNEREE